MTRAGVEVELLVFSGRENPRFTLPDAAVERVRRAVERARAAGPAAEPRRGGLGYRGLRVVNRGVEGLPGELLVGGGAIGDPAGDGLAWWRDAGGLEGELLREARAAGFGELLAGAGG